jgi:hypothetical protein
MTSGRIDTRTFTVRHHTASLSIVTYSHCEIDRKWIQYHGRLRVVPVVGFLQLVSIDTVIYILTSFVNNSLLVDVRGSLQLAKLYMYLFYWNTEGAYACSSMRPNDELDTAFASPLAHRYTPTM